MLEGLFQPMHLLLILAVAVFVFGAKKLPDLGKGLGEGIRAFKDGLRQAQRESLVSHSPEKSGGSPSMIDDIGASASKSFQS